jgi:hypothetical protein
MSTGRLSEGPTGPTVSMTRRERSGQTMAVRDVHFLAIHEPYHSVEHPVPINATIVHALTLLHPGVPQPDGGLMYRCLTEFPGRTPGCLVPVSTLTFELDGGRLWPQIADWQGVVRTVVALARSRKCDSIPLGLPHVAETLLVNGPNTTVEFFHPEGSQLQGGPERQRHLDELTTRVREFVARAPFSPGANLVSPPVHPPILPYQPYDRQSEGGRMSRSNRRIGRRFRG